MHIAIFSESYPPVTNGVAVSVGTLRRELLQRGHRVTVITVRHPQAPAQEEDVIRFPSFTWLFAPDYPLPQPRPLPALHRFFRENHVDVIHVQIPFLLGVIGLRMGRRHGIPVVAHYHTLYDCYLHYAPVLPQGMLRTLLWWHLRRFYRGAQATVVPSHFACRYLQQHGVPSRMVEVIPTGVEFHPLTVQRDEARARYGLPPERPILVYVGRMAREKNLSLLLEMLPLVQRDVPNVLLWLVGSGNAQEALHKQAQRMGLSTVVRLQGRVAHESISAVYAAADLFVFPSVTETQGLVLWEAQAHGLPCVVVNAGGAPESVRDGVDGLLVPNDAKAFAQAVVRLLKDHDTRHRMSQNALNAQRLTPGEMAERMLEVYQRVLRLSPANQQAGGQTGRQHSQTDDVRG
ncbi:MAG: 1,2-diacylglycerol 3-glucosyltransferase [Armatimonadota bacterium]|nr:MAG: 1,2-diacylglycerol 3-glucosyltransferase [Armatimonadota bacterium]